MIEHRKSGDNIKKKMNKLIDIKVGYKGKVIKF